MCNIMKPIFCAPNTNTLCVNFFIVWMLLLCHLNHLSKIFLCDVFVVLSLQVSGNCFQICCDSLLKAWLFFECNTGVVMMTSESKIWAMYP